MRLLTKGSTMMQTVQVSPTYGVYEREPLTLQDTAYRYKCGRIYTKVTTEYARPVITVYRVRVDQFAYLVEVKSEHAAKILITKHARKIAL